MHIRDDKVLFCLKKFQTKHDFIVFARHETKTTHDFVSTREETSSSGRHVSVFDQIFETEARADVYLAWRGMNFVLSHEK